MVLMLDPALSDYTLTQAVNVGRKLEKLDFYWLEEPFYDSFVGKYAELAAHARYFHLRHGSVLRWSLGRR